MSPPMKITDSKSSKTMYYRDFHKDIKDLLSKNYAQSTIWKIESKFKGPKGKIYVNPTASSNDKISADVEYLFRDYDAAVKVHVSSANDLRATGSITEQGHKAELVLGLNKKFELSHECIIQEQFSAHEKLTNDTIEVGFGLKAHPLVQVGCGASYTFIKKRKEFKWTSSCRIYDAGRAMNIRIVNGKALEIGVISPLNIGIYRPMAVVEVTRDRNKKAIGTIGIEVDSVFMKGDTIKGRTNTKLDWAISYIAKIADSWTATVTIDKNLKAGVIFTHS